ncbi:DNA-binding protein [Bacteroidia bacterium]|nr:DNA-binding protein [Bacteroidia bacterium]
MEVLNGKSEAVVSFFTAMDEMLDLMGKALKNRTPHLNGEKFLTGKDVCRMLHISPRTLQEWRTRGKIPFLRLKGKILYKESEITKWLGNKYLLPIE